MVYPRTTCRYWRGDNHGVVRFVYNGQVSANVCWWIFGGILVGFLDFVDFVDFSIFEKSTKIGVLPLGFDRLAENFRQKLSGRFGGHRALSQTPQSAGRYVYPFVRKKSNNAPVPDEKSTKNPPKIHEIVDFSKNGFGHG